MESSRQVHKDFFSSEINQIWCVQKGFQLSRVTDVFSDLIVDSLCIGIILLSLTYSRTNISQFIGTYLLGQYLRFILQKVTT